MGTKKTPKVSAERQKKRFENWLKWVFWKENKKK